MGNFGYGFRILWRIWRDADFAGRVRQLEAGKLVPPPKADKAEPKKPRRSEALTLLSVLQREARLVDFIKEPIAGYADAQIGAAVRDVHKNCAAVLDRMFGIEPLAQAAEGATLEVPRGFDPAQYRLTGQIPNEPPFRGTVQHHGWKATRCELPDWTGTDASVLVVAPAEVEINAVAQPRA